MAQTHEYYIQVEKEVAKVLKQYHCNTANDASIIFQMYLHFPCCINEEGQYSYKGVLYDSIFALPDKAKRGLPDRIWDACSKYCKKPYPPMPSMDNISY